MRRSAPDVLTYQTEPLDDRHHRCRAGEGRRCTSRRPAPTPTSSSSSSTCIRTTIRRPRGTGRAQPVHSNAVKMGGYQQLVRGEPFRGKYRHGFDEAGAVRPGRARRRSPTSARHLPRLPQGAPHDGAGPELVVPADRSQSAGLHGNPDGRAGRLQEGDRARVPGW